MFYPELSSIENYKMFSAVIDELDTWLATLPSSEQDKITTSRFSIKFNIDYELAEMLLEKCCELGILVKQFALTCPECEHVLKISSEDKLYEDLVSITDCYACDASDIVIDPNSIYVLYKLIRKPTNSPDKLKTLFDEKLNNKERTKSESSYAKQLEKNFANPNKVFYSLDDMKQKKLVELLLELKQKHKNTKAHGDVLEDLAVELLNTVKCFNATKGIRTPTNQIDCTVRNCTALSSSVFDEIGSFFIAECKNEKDKAGNTYYHKLSDILRPMGGKLGILFSVEDVTSTCSIIARENFLDSKIVIININYKDLERIIKDRYNLLDLIQAKILTVKINSTKPLQDTQMFK